MDDLQEALRNAHLWEVETSRETFYSARVINGPLIQALEKSLGTVPGWIRNQSLTTTDWNKLQCVRDLRSYLPPGYILVAVEGSKRTVYGYTDYDLTTENYDLRMAFTEENAGALPPFHMITRPPTWLVLR